MLAAAGRRRGVSFHARATAGFTLFELLLVIAIVGILAAVLLNRALWYQERAEKAAMEQVAAALQSALNLKMAKLAAQNKLPEAVSLAQENPMNWLAKQPPNYRGEYFDPPVGEAATGNWYFDLKQRELVYLVERGDSFRVVDGERKWVRYRVKLVYNEQHKTAGEVEGAVIEPEVKYAWFGD